MSFHDSRSVKCEAKITETLDEKQSCKKHIIPADNDHVSSHEYRLYVAPCKYTNTNTLHASPAGVPHRVRDSAYHTQPVGILHVITFLKPPVPVVLPNLSPPNISECSGLSRSRHHNMRPSGPARLLHPYETPRSYLGSPLDTSLLYLLYEAYSLYAILLPETGK